MHDEMAIGSRCDETARNLGPLVTIEIERVKPTGETDVNANATMESC